jgi:light-harvesting complex I chlorophyll a/b binding protein 1
VPFDLSTLLGVEFLAMATLEAKRNEETDPVKRCYPGGAFDPMGMSKGDNFAKMKAKEIANGACPSLPLSLTLQATTTSLFQSGVDL